jgi:hypothetical protein
VERWLVACDFAASGSLGETYSVSITSDGDVTATGATTNQPITPSGAPVSGNYKTRNAGSLTLSQGTHTPVTGNLPNPPNSAPMFQFRLEASPAENVTVTSVTFTAGGTGNPANDISSVDLYNDVDDTGTVTGSDTLIASGGTFSGGGTVQFTSLTETIQAGTANAEHWLVVCTVVNGTVGNTYSVSIAANADMTASGVTSGANISPMGAPVQGNLLTLSAAPPLVISTTRIPPARDSSYYSWTLHTTGGTPSVTWSIASGTLPNGISLNPATGVLSGTITAPGSVFTVRATDSGTPAQTDTQALGMEVDPAGSATVSVASTGGATYATITAAILNLPNPLNSCYIIEIRDSATYIENVVVNYTAGSNPSLILRSRYDCQPTIQAMNITNHALSIQANNVTVQGLRITGATSSNMCGINVLNGVWNTAIKSCVVFGNDIGIDNSGNSNTTIANNTIYGPHGIYVGGATACVVENNIVWATGTWAHRCYATPASNCDFNLYYAPSGSVGYDGTNFYNTLANWQGFFPGDLNSLSGNPNLANATGGDFHLTSSSALAIDQGTTPFSLFTDAEGYARNQGSGWDIGAYEWK